MKLYIYKTFKKDGTGRNGKDCMYQGRKITHSCPSNNDDDDDADSVAIVVVVLVVVADSSSELMLSSSSLIFEVMEQHGSVS